MTRKLRLSDPHAELPIKNHKYVKNCTELYMANKHIDKIANFDAFVNLEVLWINGNQVYLDLFGNPVVEEENYRLQVIRAIPSLDVLDRHVITDDERAKAAR
ncbi:hypothetical protein JG687_00000431 [Phytophthora cactorum]|uniref:Uncharacterized protein n=1 Tax=Phytophthora cactorum TaxID=29920 RepID=A0A8T1V3L6_9STRA|nr:hypothetical protein JG687_00000431 [Phytophthora cactorum]